MLSKPKSRLSADKAGCAGKGLNLASILIVLLLLLFFSGFEKSYASTGYKATDVNSK
jgi:hypothetical protein